MENEHNNVKRELFWFFGIAFAWSWLLNLPRVLHTFGVFPISNQLSFVLGTLAVFGPAVAAFLLTKRQAGSIGVSRLFKWAWEFGFPKIWLIPTLFLIPLSGLLSWLVLKLMGKTIDWTIAQPLSAFPIVLFVILILNALPEEFGWRGYALERLLTRWNPLVASLILGSLWGFWHLPLHFIGGTTQFFIPVVEYFLQTVLLAVLYTWIYTHSNHSLVLVIILHTTANLTGAYLPTWASESGRWTMFLIQLVMTGIIMFLWKPWQKSEKE